MYNKDNIFAKIIRGEIPAKKIYEDEKLIAFHDIAPVALVHVLVIPKQEYQDFNEFVAKANAEDIQHFFKTIKLIAENLNIEEKYRIVSNIGSKAGQAIFHFHMHIISGPELHSKLL